ncbi:hypothetical protein [Spirulina sp. 06S082]|uniref:hypothetical protein n=1 Tax=Spirulina sp. 06S082 TaxID=3110248 RepID=UPI002B1F68E3|nr:hypothetical protein [Spirulina sp. 06S082]MEA5467581.1 hypothetical protein [Spirulina sp. 06S082]
MHLFKLKKIFAIFIVLAVFGFTACTSTPSEFAQADRDSQQENVTTTTTTPESPQASPQKSLKEIQKESSTRGASAVADNAVAGGKLNKFFPKPGNGYDVVYAQEKTGFAQAKWKKGGTELAAISISDIASTPTAADKFANSTSKIKGYPSASQGSKGTGVLVGRFQVKVLSRDASFSESDRQALLAKFDLSGLENLVKPIANTPPTRQTKQETKQEFKDTQKESTQRKAEAVAKDAIKGGQFNKFFPKPGNGYDVVFAQEKKGFAQAKLKKGGKEVALLSVSDIISTPASATKYAGSKEKIQGYPVAQKGTKGTGVLVKDRLQIQVMSSDTSFSESDRQDWLQKFDLSGLAQLVK